MHTDAANDDMKLTPNYTYTEYNSDLLNPILVYGTWQFPSSS